MNQFFKNGFKLETESLNALNEAYYETNDDLKSLLLLHLRNLSLS